MNTLTLEELITTEKSTTSSLTKKVISGHISVVISDDREEEKGTFILVDRITQTYIPCIIDLFPPQLLETKLYMNRWVYINDDDLGIYYVQIQLSHIFKDESCTEPVFPHVLETCCDAFYTSIQEKKYFHQPSLLLSSSIQTPTHITGIVSAISILFIKPDEPASFFIQLVNTTKESNAVTISIAFHGDSLIKYYAYFQIGVAYMFQNVDLAIIGRPPNNQNTIFSFIDTQSSCHMISLNQFYTEIPIAPLSLSHQTASQSPSLMISQHTTTPNSTYAGKITRVIDSMFGIYELDNKLIICLFHSLGYSPSRPYRLHTLIRLHHVHVALIHCEDGKTSHLFQKLWQAPSFEQEGQYMVLVACVKSHIHTIEFGLTADVSESMPSFISLSTVDAEMREFIYMDSLERHCTFSKLIRQLEIYAALTVKFADTLKDMETFKQAYTKIRDTTFASTRTHTSAGARNFINDFFHHERLCAAVGEGLTNNTFHVTVESYPFLNGVQEYLDQHLEEHVLKLPGTQETRYERGQVHTQIADYRLTDNDYCILGQLQVGEDSRLYLADDVSRVLITLCRSKLTRVGHLFMVRQCRWVKENLSFKHDKTHQPVWCNYMSVDDRWLVSLQPPDVCFQSPVRGKRYRLDSPRDFEPLVAMHVVDKYPAEMQYGRDGSVSFSCRVIAQLRPITGVRTDRVNTFLENGEDRKFMVVLSASRHHDLHVGTDWVVEGLVVTSAKVYLNAEHQLYPLVIGSCPDAVSLVPAEEEHEVEERKVYHVSDLILPRDEEVKGKVHAFYDRAVCMQGVVVSKRFVDGFKLHKTSDCLSRYETLGVGTGKWNRKLLLQVREMQGLDVMYVYMDVDRTHYPLGLVVGSVVKIHHMLRKESSSRQFGIADSSFIEVTSMEAPLLSLVEQPTRTITSFIDPVLGVPEEESGEIFKLYVYIQSFMSLTMKWLCQWCGSVIQHGECYGMCEDAPRIFMANAYVRVSDGTSSAYVTVDGERLVFDMLQLTAKQADGLKSVTLELGEISHGSWETVNTDNQPVQQKNLHGYTLSDLCEKARSIGQFWLFGKVQAPKKNENKRSLDFDDTVARPEKRQKTDYIKEFQLRPVSVSDSGRLIRTLELSKLKLKAIHLEFPEARLVAYDILQHLEQ